MPLDSWKNALKMATGDPQKIMIKSTKNMKLSAFFSGFGGLNNTSYFFLRSLSKGQFFLSFNFYFGHKTPKGLETWENFT